MSAATVTGHGWGGDRPYPSASPAMGVAQVEPRYCALPGCREVIVPTPGRPERRYCSAAHRSAARQARRAAVQSDPRSRLVETLPWLAEPDAPIVPVPRRALARSATVAAPLPPPRPAGPPPFPRRRRALAVLGIAGILAGGYAATASDGAPDPGPPGQVVAGPEEWADRAGVALTSINRQLDTIAETERAWAAAPAALRSGEPPAAVRTLMERKALLLQQKAALQAQLESYRSLRRAETELAAAEAQLRSVEQTLAAAPPPRERTPEQAVALETLGEQRDHQIRRRDVKREEVAGLQENLQSATATPLPAADDTRTERVSGEVLEVIRDGREREVPAPVGDPLPRQPEVVGGRDEEAGKPRQEVDTSGPPDPRGPRDESAERGRGKGGDEGRGPVGGTVEKAGDAVGGVVGGVESRGREDRGDEGRGPVGGTVEKAGDAVGGVAGGVGGAVEGVGGAVGGVLGGPERLQAPRKERRADTPGSERGPSADDGDQGADEGGSGRERRRDDAGSQRDGGSADAGGGSADPGGGSAEADRGSAGDRGRLPGDVAGQSADRAVVGVVPVQVVPVLVVPQQAGPAPRSAPSGSAGPSGRAGQDVETGSPRRVGPDGETGSNGLTGSPQRAGQDGAAGSGAGRYAAPSRDASALPAPGPGAAEPSVPQEAVPRQRSTQADTAPEERVRVHPVLRAEPAPAAPTRQDTSATTPRRSAAPDEPTTSRARSTDDGVRYGGNRAVTITRGTPEGTVTERTETRDGVTRSSRSVSPVRSSAAWTAEPATSGTRSEQRSTTGSRSGDPAGDAGGSTRGDTAGDTASARDGGSSASVRSSGSRELTSSTRAPSEARAVQTADDGR